MRTAFLLVVFTVAFGVLAAGASPQIVRPAVARSEDGPPVFAPESFVAGESVHFSFYVEDYTRVGNALKLGFEAQPKDAAGVSLAPPVIDEQTFTLTPEDKNWIPKFRGSFNLPGVLAAGTYHLFLQIDDKFSHQAAARDIPFLVDGIALEESRELAIRNLAFYRNEDEEKPLANTAFRAAEEIHARFQIVGYRHGNQGSNDVVYGISVMDRSGRILFGEPNAAEDKSSEFYPKPFVPGIFSFSLKSGTPPGEYVLTVTARDSLGSQQAEAHRSFRLE